MAKKRATSIRSRAARRASSPSINTDKSLKDITPPRAERARPSVLAVHQSAGVSKKSKSGRKAQLSHKARRRQEKGLEMAEAVTERTTAKVQKSLGRGRNIKERARTWDDINRAAGDGVKVGDGEGEGGGDDDDDDGGDDDMGEAKGSKSRAKQAKLLEMDDEMAGAPEEGPADAAAAPAVAAPVLDADDDEIL